MNILLVAATAIAVVSSVPESGPSIIFRENKHTIVFNQTVLSQKVEMIDSDGCTVSKGSQAVGNTVVVQMQACTKIGYPVGVMEVRWTVNGKSGKYDLHIQHHH